MNENVPSDIIAKFQAKYDLLRQQCECVGEPIEPGIYRTLDGAWQCNYRDWCAIVIRPGETEPHETHGAIGQRWYREWGAFDISGKRGALGHPISDEEIYEDDDDPNDRISHFENGDIIWTAKTDETRVANIKDSARWYKTKHDQLLELLREAVEAPAPERHNEALRAVDEKCREDQFDVVLLGEFQYGKSTTLDTLCRGREMSPQGEGTTPTSAVPVSVQSLGRDEPDEWGEIRFKSKRELAAEIFDTFESELSDPESNHNLKRFLRDGDGLARNRFRDGFDIDNPEHLTAVRSALEDAWTRFSHDDRSKFKFSTRQRQLMEVTTLVVRFYDTDEYRTMLQTTHLGVGDIGSYVWFPSDWSQLASQGFGYNVSFEDARFAFVDKAILHLRSPFLEELGCRVTDCPGLDASAYDKEVTRRALLKADGVLFVHRCTKMVGASTLGELFEFVRDTGRTDKTVLALNLWGISRNAAIVPGTDRRGRPTPSIVGASERQIRNEHYEFPVLWCHVLLAYLSALGERRIQTKEAFSKEERRWLAEKANVIDEGQSDEELWICAVNQTNVTFRVTEINGLSVLDDVSVSKVRKASNFDALLKVVSETVLREKTGSILVDNGSQKALDTLRSHERELEIKEDEARRSEAECADEVEKARLALAMYEEETKEKIKASYLVTKKDDTCELLSRALMKAVVSSDNFIRSLAKGVGRIVHELNSELVGWSREQYEKRFHSEITPRVADLYIDHALCILEDWDKHPYGRWKTLVSDNEDLRKEIEAVGCKYLKGNRLLKAIPIPRLPTLSVELLLSYLEINSEALNDIAETLREGFFTGVWHAFKFVCGGFLRNFFTTEEEREQMAVEDYANEIYPKLVEAFNDARLQDGLVNAMLPSFHQFIGAILRSLESSQTAYRKKIEDWLEELIAAHDKSIDELKKIAEECRKLREERIAPLRKRIEAFEQTVKSVETAKG